MSSVNLKIICALTVLGLSYGYSATAGAQLFSIESDDRIVDQAGRRVGTRKAFARIISLYGAHTENLFYLGAERQIIGVSRHESYPPQALTKPVFSYHDGPERFLAADPDLVLIRPMIDRGYPNLIRQLEKSGITVVSLQPGDVSEMFVYWQILGMLTGRHAAADQMAGDFKQAIENIRQLTAARDDKKRVYFEAIHGKMKTFTPGSMAIYALETAGGINIAADARAVRRTNIAFYGKERLLSKADQIDVYLAQTGSMNRPSVALIENEPGYQAIKAVREGQIYIIDETVVSRPTMRLLNGICKIGEILYPEIFNRSVRAELKIQ